MILHCFFSKNLFRLNNILALFAYHRKELTLITVDVSQVAGEKMYLERKENIKWEIRNNNTVLYV